MDKGQLKMKELKKSQSSTAHSPLPKGYKQTEVGVIPEDWEISDLNAVCAMKSGETITSARISDYAKYPCYGGNGLRGYTSSFNHEGFYALVGRQGALCGNVLGVSGQFFASEHAIVVTPNSKISVFWLTYVLGEMGLNQYTESSAQPGLSVSKILKLRIPLPPTKAEQAAIAEALSDADALIESLEQLIAKKRQIKQGAMQELLTGKRRLPGFSGEWEVKRLGELGKCYRGVSYSPSDLSAHDTNSTIRLLRSNNVQNSSILFSDMQYVNYLRVSEHQHLQEKDVLICMANGSRQLVGKAGQFHNSDGHKYTFGAFMGAFRPDQTAVNADYVYMLFSTQAYRHHIDLLLAGSSINNLRPSSVEELQLLVPNLEEQTAIAEILSDMDSEIDALEAKLTKARQIKQGMMQELLTGKTRLV